MSFCAVKSCKLDARRQRMLLRIAVDLEAPAAQIEHEKRLAPLRDRFAARQAQPARELRARRLERVRSVDTPSPNVGKHDARDRAP